MSALGVVHASDRWVCTPAPDHSGWQCASSDGSALPQAANPPATTAPQRTPQSVPPEPLKPTMHVLDWVPRGELPASKLAVLPEYCDGAYVEPAFTPMSKAEIAAAPIRARADQVQYYLQEHGELSGNVEVIRGNQSLIASKATFHEPQQSVTVDDGLTLREPGMLVEGKAGLFMVDSGAATITDAQFVLQPNDLRGTAQQLDRDADGNLKVVHGSFTRCEPGNEEWKVTGSSVQVDDGAKYGTAHNAVLKVHDVPIFYSPYLRFPVTSERMSGWLFPDVGFGSSNGVDIAVPYYLNLAPNYDATITPRYIQDRGNDLEGEFRELSPFGRMTLVGSYLPKDDEYNGKYSRTDFDNLGIPGPFDPADRWLWGVKQSARLDGFTTDVNATKVSDFDYFRDLGSSLASASQVELQQYASVAYAHGGFTSRVWVQDFQRLDAAVTEPYRRLPEVDLNYSSTVLGPLTASVASSWASFDRPNDQFTGIQRINGDRLDFEPRVRLPFDWAAGFLRFVGGYRWTQYDLQDVPVGDDDQPIRRIWMGSVDSGLYLERDSEIFGTPVLQTLEPRLFYLYQQYRNQDGLPQFDTSELSFTFDQLFRDNRFAGIDRIGDADQLTAAVTTRWLSGQTGIERLRMSLGEIFYFEDRNVTLNGVKTADDEHATSAYAGEIAAAISDHLNFLSSGTWDPNGGDWQEAGVGLQYKSDDRHIFNLAYRRRTDITPLIKQSDVSMYWSIFRQWAWIARFDYDLEEHRTIEALAGLEYSDCCWQLRSVWRKYSSAPGGNLTPDAQSDEGIFFQIVFKGLAGFGGRIDSMMKSGIPGYVPEEH